MNTKLCCYLSYYERLEIEKLIKEGLNVVNIAKKLKRDPAVIRNELKNFVPYNAKEAHRNARYPLGVFIDKEHFDKFPNYKSKISDSICILENEVNVKENSFYKFQLETTLNQTFDELKSNILNQFSDLENKKINQPELNQDLEKRILNIEMQIDIIIDHLKIGKI